MFTGKPNTIQMDIYSMGIVFYILATLKHPYELSTSITDEDGWKRAHLSMIAEVANNVNRDLPIQMGVVIKKMMEKNPNMRYHSWAEIRDDLAKIELSVSTAHFSAIEKIMSKRVAEQTERQKQETEHQRIRELEEQKQSLIDYQFNNEILTPIKDFIDSYNRTIPTGIDKMILKPC